MLKVSCSYHFWGRIKEASVETKDVEEVLDELEILENTGIYGRMYCEHCRDMNYAHFNVPALAYLLRRVKKARLVEHRSAYLGLWNCEIEREWSCATVWGRWGVGGNLKGMLMRIDCRVWAKEVARVIPRWISDFAYYKANTDKLSCKHR